MDLTAASFSLHEEKPHQVGEDLYESDILMLMPIDTVSLYAYWDISTERKMMVESHFQSHWDALPKILRLYDVSWIDFNGHHANSLRDIQINNQADHWFVYDVNDQCHYCMDYGTTALDGRFIPILRSNTVHTPRKSETDSKLVQTRILKPATHPENELPSWFANFTGYSMLE